MRSVLIYVIIGIGIGAMMHGYVPEGFFEHYMARDNWFTVPLAVVLAVPMYANAAGIVPIIEVFVAKGIPLGTAIAFMMGVVGLSLPEATLLKKVITWRLIGVFFGTLFLLQLLQLAPKRVGSVGCAYEELFVTLIGSVVVLDEVAKIDLRLPLVSFETSPSSFHAVVVFMI